MEFAAAEQRTEGFVEPMVGKDWGQTVMSFT